MTVSEEKQQSIKESLKATREKQKHQRCQVFELKVTLARSSKRAIKHLQRLFLEGKWFYNWLLSQEDVFAVDTKVREVPVKGGDTFETRPLRCLSSQMNQSLATRVETSIKGLSTKKKIQAQVVVDEDVLIPVARDDGKMHWLRTLPEKLRFEKGNNYG